MPSASVAAIRQQLLPHPEWRKRVLHKHLRDEWYARKRRDLVTPVLMFAPEGLVLGAGTVIVAASGPRRLQSLRGQETRVLALLSAACGKAVAPPVLGSIERATKAWSEGDDCLAYIHLSYAGLEPLDNLPAGAYRLYMARCALLAGASPHDVFKALHLDARYVDAVEKTYNPSQPRVPAGSGRTSGEWTNVDGISENTLEEGSDGDGTAQDGTTTDATTEGSSPGSSLLSRAPLPAPAASFLSRLTAAQVVELGAYALRLLRLATPVGAAAAIFWLLFIPSPNEIHMEGDVPEIPGLRYSWNRDETQIHLTYDAPTGERRTFAAYVDGKDLRDENGKIIGRVLSDKNIAIDVLAVWSDLTKNEPRLCPGPVLDKPGSDRGKPYEENIPRQYEDFLKQLINPGAPTPSGFVYELLNPNDIQDMVSYDDCQKTTGILWEYKWVHADVRRFVQGDLSVQKKFLAQAKRQVAASEGRPIVWIFGEEETAVLARQLFRDADEGRERIIILHREWEPR
jgi:hypothetical protein